jgi:hypothetical protein
MKIKETISKNEASPKSQTSKKNIKLISFLFVLFLFVFCSGLVSCERETDDLSLIDFKIPDGCVWAYGYFYMGISYHYIVVVNSQEELAKSLYCESVNTPSINFKEKTMLIFLSTHSGKVITKKLEKRNELEYILNIEMEQTNIGNCEFAVLTSKISENAQVEATVNLKIKKQ